jgi:hypothetical protein
MSTTRALTEAETSSFYERGWAFIPGLIPAEVAGSLLERAETMLGATGADHALREVDRDLSFFSEYQRPDQDDELFRSVLCDPQLGQSVGRLLGGGRDISVRSLTNIIATKRPQSSAADRGGTQATAWHQDHGSSPVRSEALVVWIALTEITPDMGSMRFFEGSHRLGWLPGEPDDPQNWLDIVPESWPRLMDECPLSEPLHYQPGDATVHGTLTVHGAPANTTDRPRWAYACTYFPAHAVYTGAQCHYTKDILDELTVFSPLDHPRFPLVYERESTPADNVHA